MPRTEEPGSSTRMEAGAGRADPILESVFPCRLRFESVTGVLSGARPAAPALPILAAWGATGAAIVLAKAGGMPPSWLAASDSVSMTAPCFFVSASL